MNEQLKEILTWLGCIGVVGYWAFAFYKHRQLKRFQDYIPSPAKGKEKYGKADCGFLPAGDQNGVFEPWVHGGLQCSGKTACFSKQFRQSVWLRPE